MNVKRKLQQLFESARNEPMPQPGEEFVSGLMREVGRGVLTAPRTDFDSPSILDQLASLFPRLAMASILGIALCVAADYCLANFVQPDFSSSAAELSEQWLFAAK